MMEPYTLTGKVVHGRGLGRTVGMPTANLCVENGALPETGVYASRVRIGSRAFGSVTNIGTRPSVDEDKDITVEVYIFDFDEDIYEAIITLELIEFLRPIQKFQNLEEVYEQVKKDIEKAKNILTCEI